MTTWNDDENGGTVWSEDEAAGTALGAANGSSLVGFAQSGSGALSTDLQTRGRRFILAHDYGAFVADGSTDNATAFTNLNTALSSGDVVIFPRGTYRTTSPIPIKSGVTYVGDGPGNTILEYYKQATGIAMDDGNTAMTVNFRGLTLRRTGDGTSLSGAAQSERYTIRQQHASSVFRFWDCVLDDSGWTIGDGAWDALTSVVLDGTAYFNNCQIAGVGRGVFTNSGTIWFLGEINVASKAFANHGGEIHAKGLFKATAASGAAGTISVAAGTTYIDGDIIRTNDTLGSGILGQVAGTVFATGTIRSSGSAVFNNGSTLVNFTGNAYAVAGNAARSDGGELNVSGYFESEANAIVCVSGTFTANGIVKAAATTGQGITCSGGTTYFNGSVETGGASIVLSGAATVLWANGNFKSGSNNSNVSMSGGTLKIDGRIEAGNSAIIPSGSTAKIIDIGSLDIVLTGGNAARRAILYGASTNCTVTARHLSMTVDASATACISTDAGNTQTITAGSLLSNKAVAADIVISPSTFHPLPNPAHIYSAEYNTGTRYSRLAIKHATTTLSAVSGATVTATNLIPTKANVMGVNTIVVTALGTGGGTTGYTVGDGVDADRWGAVVATAAGTDTDGTDATADPTGYFNAANNVVITATGGNFNGTGAIFVDVMYWVTEAD